MPTRRYTPDTPVAGGALPLTPAQEGAIVNAIESRPNGEYQTGDIAIIVAAYNHHASRAGMDPVMPLAQMLHETGWLSSWWSQRPRRNPAGIGVTGRNSLNSMWLMGSGGPFAVVAANRDGIWVEGCSFASWADDAVPAHLGRLLAYALTPTTTQTLAQQQLIRTALHVRPLPPAFRGAAPTWAGLQGRWAVPTWAGLQGRWAVPGMTYAYRIADIANRLVT